MADVIKDGTGNGYTAKVSSDNRLYTRSKSDTIQHSISMEDKYAFQVIGVADLNESPAVALHFKNEHSTKKMVVTYIRHQIIDIAGGTTLPNFDNYYRITLGRTYVSGGTEATPVNVYAGSGNLSEVLVYTDNPSLEGTSFDIDRWYSKAEGDMNAFNKEGSLIIPPGETLELSYVGDHTSGKLYTRLSFLMDDDE